MYEILIKELTRSIIKEDLDRKKIVLSFLKEYFGKDKALRKELDLYKTLTESKQIPTKTAEKIFFEIKERYKTFNKKEMFNQQTKLIKNINKRLSKKVFDNFVPEYKKLASISQYLNEELTVKQKVFLEEKILMYMCENEEVVEKQYKSTDKLVFKKFVENFNNLYSENLLEEQRVLLQNYVSSGQNNSLDLKIYLNEELGRIKDKITSIIKKDDFDDKTKNKLNKIYQNINNLKTKKINSKEIKDIMKVQNLIHEATK